MLQSIPCRLLVGVGYGGRTILGVDPENHFPADPPIGTSRDAMAIREELGWSGWNPWSRLSGPVPEARGLYIWTGQLHCGEAGQDPRWRGEWRPATLPELRGFGFGVDQLIRRS
jgi:hypothetical protein